MKSTICVVLICSVLAIDADHISNCSAALSCDACLAKPTCAWCFGPQAVSTPRCFHQPTENTSGSTCREEYTYNPETSVEFLNFPIPPSRSSSSSSSPNHHNWRGNSNKNYITPEHVRASMRIGSKIRLRIMYTVNEDFQNQSLDISLADNSSNSLSVRYFTKCLTETETETNKCHGVKVGDGVIYTIQLELLSCPANSNDWNQKLQIRPENLNGQLIVDLSFFCSCPIEMQGCSGNGHIVNGVCQCNGNYFGDNCECVGEESPSTGCRANDTVSVDCSDRGTCICGQCECHVREDPDEEIYGKYCEIDDYSCARGFEGLCSGRGPCILGKCVCNEGWQGAACDSKKKTCKSPTISVECSGHGTCKNNTCTCLESTVDRYYGEHCDKYELKKSSECHWQGLLVNGQCVCHENYFGQRCECSTKSGIKQDNCRPDNATTMECSGRGSCVCGHCECDIRIHPQEKIYGEYCECDNFSCDVANGLLCSGRGPCVCGQCLCPEGWSGSSCNCTTSTDTCISPIGTNQQICSGHGECICGLCQCSNDKDGNSYTGQYCTAVPEQVPQNESTNLNENSN